MAGPGVVSRCRVCPAGRVDGEGEEDSVAYVAVSWCLPVSRVGTLHERIDFGQ